MPKRGRPRGIKNPSSLRSSASISLAVETPKRGRPKGSKNRFGKSQEEAKRSKICGSSDEDHLAGNSTAIQCKSSDNSQQQPDSIITETKFTETRIACESMKKAAVQKVPNNAAVRSTPDGLQVAPSSIPGAGFGVWTRQAITKGTMFGPYEGVKIHSEIDARKSGYAWEIYKDDKLTHYVDGRSLKKSNWLRYVNSALSESEQNVFPVQYSGEIYYRACVDIPVDTELLTWYGEHYAEELGLLNNPSNSTGSNTTKMAKSSFARKRFNCGEGSSKSNQSSGMKSTQIQ